MIEEAKEEKQNEATELKQKMNLLHILRWVLLLLVIFCGASIMLVKYFHALIFIVEYVDPREPFRIFGEIIIALSFFIYGLSFIFLGAVITPKYKKSIAYANSLLLCSFYYIAHLIFLYSYSKGSLFHDHTVITAWYLLGSQFHDHTIITALYLLLGGVLAASIIPLKKSRTERKKHLRV